MTGEPSSAVRQDPRWRRRLLLVLLALLLMAAAWTCRGAVDRGADDRSPAPSAGAMVPSPTPAPTTVGPTPAPTGVHPTPAPTTSHPTPSPTATLATPAPTATHATPAPTGNGGGGGEAQTGGADFWISGAGVGDLRPGATKSIPLKLTNPNSVPIYVTGLSVTISAGSTPPGCSSADNLQLVQSDASSGDPILVPANGSVTITSAPRAPSITLLNLPDVNQDACKNKTFSLTYSGTAHS